MKGTEKQVKYAEDIIKNTRESIDRMIEQYKTKAAQAPYIFGVDYEEWQNAKNWFNDVVVAGAEKRDLPASWYIENKERLSIDFVANKVNQACTMRGVK